ncbi:MAG: DNA-directed DNA polymerase II small subunit [Methanobacteriota archaeon]|nr:MAG: DNA-directed DNA polymerase II small subunit [Euryarchaeota archaeon]
MDRTEIVCRFLERDLCVHPTVLHEIASREDPDEFVERFLSSVKKKGIITLQDLQSFDVEVRRGGRRAAEEYESEVEIRDPGEASPAKGSLEGFVQYFNSRYEKGLRVFRERSHLKGTITVSRALEAAQGSEVKVVGLVTEIRKSKKGNTILVIEDPTGTVPAVIPSSESRLADLSKSIVHDDVVCVDGVIYSNKGNIIIANELFLPDVPIEKDRGKGGGVPLSIALVSDIHLGSYEFMEREFMRFIKWLRGEVGSEKQKRLAESVKYLVVAGDVVDGVGIYPGQLNDLQIKDIYEQYSRVAELLEMVPDYIDIIISPGNHDATSQAEPQPAIFRDFAERLYENPSIRMVGNPCYVKLHGTSVLVYHGRSMDDIISTVPGMSYSRPETAMLELLKKRQLVPIFGEKVPVSPRGMDCLFIDEVPDIFHTGHVHTTGASSYRGINIINSGAFQSQTEYQRKLNLHPDPGKVPIFNMETGKTVIMKFAG